MKYTKEAYVIGLPVEESNGFKKGSEHEDLERDGWGWPFIWVMEKPEESVCVIRIVSTGDNGVYEGGAGDDCLVEMRFSGRGDPEVRFRPEPKR